MKIEIFRRSRALRRPQWYFRIKARNGEPVAQSEGYNRRLDAVHTAELLRADLAQAEIVDA